MLSPTSCWLTSLGPTLNFYASLFRQVLLVLLMLTSTKTITSARHQCPRVGTFGTIITLVGIQGIISCVPIFYMVLIQKKKLLLFFLFILLPPSWKIINMGTGRPEITVISEEKIPCSSGSKISIFGQICRHSFFVLAKFLLTGLPGPLEKHHPSGPMSSP